MNAAPFSRWVVAGAVLLSARCLLAQAAPSDESTNAPAFETAAISNAQYAIRQRLYPVIVERVESPFDVANSDPAALIYDWADTNAGRVPPAGPIRPPANNQPVEPVDSRFKYLPLIEFTNFGHTAGSTVQITNQQWGEGLLDLEVATDFAPATSWDKPETNVTGSVESPALFEVPATNSKSFYRGSLHSP